MSQPILLVDNSFSRLVNFPPELLSHIKSALTYKDLEAERERKRLFMMMRRARLSGKSGWYYALKDQFEKLPPSVVCWLNKDKFCTGHLGIVADVMEKFPAVDYKVEDKRALPEPYLSLRWENEPPSLRYYQSEMLQEATKHERGVFEAAVGTGKSLVITHLIKQKAVNTLVIVPSKPLRRQMFKTLCLAYGSDKVEIVDAASVKRLKRAHKPIRVCNVQSLAALQKKGLIDTVIGDIDMIIVDEVHHAGAKSYVNLLDELGHVYYRYGFTGTFMRNDSKTLDMWGFLSNRLYHYTPKKALEDKYLTPVDYVVNQVQGFQHQNYAKEYELNYCGSKSLLKRILSIVEGIPKDEQILILVKQKAKSGAIITEWLKQHGHDNVYISGDDSATTIDEAIENFNAKSVRQLIGSSVIGEGVDLYSAQHLILATGGKSEISFTQAIGRAVRLSSGKAKSYVYDFSFKGTRYLDKHLRIRLLAFQRDFAGRVSIS